MKASKRKRLESAGWKVGSVAEFLALTDDEAAVVELKLDLLVRTLLRMGASRRDLARYLGARTTRRAA